MAVKKHVRPTVKQVWAWLDEVYDPEIPVVSVVDLGIVRDICWQEGDSEELVITFTPTYSGCPAVNAIVHDIEQTLHDRGIKTLRLERRISPPWTTDWITERGKQRLAGFGIAPPGARPVIAVPLGRLERRNRQQFPVHCPRCGSANTTCVSQFGSTLCKALHTCRECLEPFDHFKCI